MNGQSFQIFPFIFTPPQAVVCEVEKNGKVYKWGSVEPFPAGIFEHYISQPIAKKEGVEFEQEGWKKSNCSITTNFSAGGSSVLFSITSIFIPSDNALLAHKLKGRNRVKFFWHNIFG